MHGENSRKKYYAAIGILVGFAFAGWLGLGLWNMSQTPVNQAPLRPVTINNSVQRIESNVIRIQTAMENLAMSKYPTEIVAAIESINRLESAIYRDFKEVGSHFHSDNTHYQKVLTLFRKWKPIRDLAIELTTAGSSMQAKKSVRGNCASHAQDIRAALMALNSFSEKRADDFDSAASEAAPEKHGKK